MGTKPSLVKQVAKVVLLHPQQPVALILRLEARERARRGIDEWHLPGGSFKPDEDSTLEDTARREAAEETGLAIAVQDIVGTASWDAFYEGEPARFEATIFVAKALPDKGGAAPIVRTSRESEAAAWVGLDQLSSYPALTPEAKQYITQVLIGPVA